MHTIRRKLVALIGVDGSGKTTVIDALLPALSGSKKVCFHQGFRPGYKPDPSRKIQNHAYKPRGALISILKILFRALEWWWNYLLFCLPRLISGHVVLCDRFYFDDILVDPLKYRYGAPEIIAKSLRTLLPLPEMYILLDAPVSILLSRKQEAPVEEIERLRNAYLYFIQQQPDGYIIDASGPVNEVVEKVGNLIK